ncbi:MAG: matrixin family metalloprotease, partial [Verrucomicrobia bacterium]|nr:matrixin family metalloprotease [Verrucomicrobiota bacterium]
SAQDRLGFKAMTKAQMAAVRRAFAYYGSMINVTFKEVAGNATADINFGTNKQRGVSAGYSYYPKNSPIAGKTALFLANDQWTNSDAQVQEGGYGYETILHEIGHTLGLKHPGNYNAGGGGTGGPYLSTEDDNREHSIMSYWDNGATAGVNPTTAMPYDIAALQYLYGANTAGSNATRGAFTFTAGKNYLETLWSASGTDKIDLSGLDRSSYVDLNGGSFSSINIQGAAGSRYSGNGNVGIAYGSKINTVKLSARSGVAETVALNDAFNAGAYDRIEGFNASEDTLALKSSLFGSLTADNIEFGAAATSANSKLIVNRSTGEIFYDADGNGSASAARKIAQYTAAGSAQFGASNFAFVA